MKWYNMKNKNIRNQMVVFNYSSYHLKLSRISIVSDTPKIPSKSSHLKKIAKFSYPKKIPESNISSPPKSFGHLRYLKSGVPTPWSPLCECEIKLDHYTGEYVPYSLRTVCGFLDVL